VVQEKSLTELNKMLSADSLDNPVEKDKHVAKLFDVGKAIGTG
jgi:hypothetical protein